jgi:hypothetical protein
MINFMSHLGLQRIKWKPSWIYSISSIKAIAPGCTDSTPKKMWYSHEIILGGKRGKDSLDQKLGEKKTVIVVEECESRVE